MAIVLTVHLVESIWQRYKLNGLLAPYLVVDHNGQQQQTDIVRASTVTAWNQKATFPYVPTSDLVIMAFDAGRHPGTFLGQAEIDVAAMLSAGSLNGNAPLLNSTGEAVGMVSFGLALSTSSRAIAAGLDIPGLVLASQTRPGSPARSPFEQQIASPRNAICQDENLSGTDGAFAVPSWAKQHQRTMQQRSLQDSSQQAPNEQHEVVTSLTKKLARSAHGLGNMLGLGYLMRKSCDETGLAAAAGQPSMLPPCVVTATDQQGLLGAELRAKVDPEIGLAGFDSSPEAAGPLPGQLLAKRNSFLRSSSFGLPSAPPFPPGALSAASVAAAAGAGATSTATAAGVAVSGPFSAASRQELYRRYSSRTSRSSDCSTVSQLSSSELAWPAESRRPAFRHTRSISQSSSIGRQEQGAPCAGPTEALSPLRSSRTKLRLSPSKMAILAAQRHQQQLVRQQQLQQQQDQEQQMLLLAVEALHEQQAAAAAAGLVERGSWEEALQREYDAADAAGKEAILYKQLMLQQAEKQAGTAHMLNLIAVQQQQDAAHNTQLLAALAAMSPSTSPRHIPNTATASADSEGDSEQQYLAAEPGSPMQKHLLQHQQGEHMCSPTRYPDIPLPGRAMVAAMRRPGSPMTPCTPEFASPDMSFRTSHASMAPTPLPIGAAPAAAAVRGGSNSGSSSSAAASLAGRLQRGVTLNSDGSISGSSSANRNSSASGGSGYDSYAGSSSTGSLYPEVPGLGVRDAQPVPRTRKQWSVDCAAVAAGVRGSAGSHGSAEMWQSCDEAASALSAVHNGTADRPEERTAQLGVAIGAVAVEVALEAGSLSPKRIVRLGGSKQSAGSIPCMGEARSEHSISSLSSPRRYIPGPSSPTMRTASAEDKEQEHDQPEPAYRCHVASSGRASAGYTIVRSSQPQADPERWCMHTMADVVPYERPPPCFPYNAVSVGPSAPVG